jgi:hypothetical protein
MAEAPDIPGAQQVIDWFGYWPSFHDAEVVSIILDRSKESRIVLHTWESTARTSRETDSAGRFVLTKHAIVTFLLSRFLPDSEGITTVDIAFFNEQNVLMEVGIARVQGGYELELTGIYGASGKFIASDLRVELEPGIPPDSIYLKDS